MHSPEEGLLQKQNQLFLLLFDWIVNQTKTVSCYGCISLMKVRAVCTFCLISLYHIFHFESQVQRGSYLCREGGDTELYPGRGGDRHPGRSNARGDALPRVVSAHAGGDLRRGRAPVHHAVRRRQTSARRRQRDFVQRSEQPMLWSTFEISANHIAKSDGELRQSFEFE